MNDLLGVRDMAELGVVEGGKGGILAVFGEAVLGVLLSGFVECRMICSLGFWLALG